MFYEYCAIFSCIPCLWCIVVYSINNFNIHDGLEQNNNGCHFPCTCGQFWGDHEWRSSKLQTRTHTLFQPIVQIMQRGQWKPVERPSLKMWNFFFNWSLTSPDASWKGLTIFVRVIFEYCYSSCKQIEQSGSITKKCFDIWKLWNQMQFHILYTCYSCEKLISKC